MGKSSNYSLSKTSTPNIERISFFEERNAAHDCVHCEMFNPKLVEFYLVLSVSLYALD